MELLGYLVPLSKSNKLVFAVDVGQCSDETMQQLSPAEAAALKVATSRFKELQDGMPRIHVLVEHSEPCTWKTFSGVRFREGTVSVLWSVVLRTLCEDNLCSSAEQKERRAEDGENWEKRDLGSRR